MTENISELIAEARANVERAADATTGKQAERIRAGEVSDDRLRLLVQLADALEAEHERGDEGWRVASDQTRLERDRAEKAKAERDAAYAVIEQVKLIIGPNHGLSINEEKVWMAVHAAVPADTLREVKAEAWWEGVNHQWKHRPIGNRVLEFENPYREGADRG